VPILWSQGLLDWNVHPDGVSALWPRLTGTKRLWLGQHPHLVPSEWERGHPEVVGREGWTEEVFRFLDRHLKGAELADDPPVVVQEGAAGRWRGEPSWPPADSRPTELAVVPGSYTDGPGNKGESYCLRTEPPCAPGATGNGSWSIGAPLPYDAHLSGVPRLKAVASSTAGEFDVVAFLYDIDEQGRAALVTRGAALAHESGRIDVELYPQDWLLRRGHRLGLLLAGADDGWFEPGRSGATVNVTGGAVAVPFLSFVRDRFLPGGASQAIRERTTFQVPVATIEERAARGASPPPRMIPRPKKSKRPKLKVTVRPGSVRAGRRSTVQVRARVGRVPVSRARVRIGRREALTNKRGRVRMQVAPSRAGRFQVRVYARGTGARRVVVVVRP
jgi:hypothetical protein